MNVAHLFRRTAGAYGALPAVALGDTMVHDYRSLVRRAAGLAGGLVKRMGLAPGDRVALVMRNEPAYLETMLAAWWAGLAVVPVNAKLHPDEIAWILEHAQASVCVASDQLAPAVEGAEIPLIVAGSSDYRRLSGAEPMPLHEVAGSALAWLFYTSGTTGRPKGAMITHGNLLAMVLAYLADVDDVAPGDAMVHGAPLSHGSGLYVLPQAAKGAVQVLPDSGGFDAAEMLGLIGRWPRAALFAAPTMVQRLTREAAAIGFDPAPLKLIVYGGAPMYLADLDAAHTTFGFRLAQIYGQGESPMCITALDRRLHADQGHPRWRARLRSAGVPQLGCEVRIGDDDGQPVPTGETGEVLARGAAVVPGYWRDPEATARTMGDGWLRTGDIGSLDEDGFLTLSDRAKDLIISGGSNVYPREVEELLLRHPAVREAAVIGVPDAEWGERVVACLVADPVDEQELDLHCLSAIARFKRPRRYLFLDALPKNAYGKVLKRELRQRWG